jgi:hypothetical protein
LIVAIAAVSIGVALAPVASAAAASSSPSPSPSASSPAPKPSTQSGAASVVVDTSISLSVEPGTDLETYTPATFRAIVTPSDAQGIVTFYADGQIFGQAMVVAGQAVVESNSRSAGSANLTASFEPTAGMNFTAATSVSVPIKVHGVPALAIANKKGEAVAQGSPIKVGEPIRLIVSNFPPNTLTTFSLGNINLNAALVTDKNGNGNTVVVLSKTLPSSVYVMSAQGGKYNASFVFYVYNPISQPAPVPSSKGTGNISTSIPDDTSGGSSNSGGEGTGGGTSGGTSGGNTGSGDNGGGTIPSTGGGPTKLPHTGGDPIDLILLATMAFGCGAGALIAGRRRQYLGRHISHG